MSARENKSDTCGAVAEEDMVGWMGGCDKLRVLITTDDVINACTNFKNVVIRIMRVDESKGGCNLSKNKDMKV